MQLKPVQVKVAAPQVAVDIASPNFNVDAGEFTKVLQGLADGMQQIAAQQTAILQALQELAGKDAPKVDVKLPATQRPDSFHVSVEKENGETAEMRISARKSH